MTLGSWVDSGGEFAKITSLRVEDGKTGVEGLVYEQDGEEVGEVELLPVGLKPIPVSRDLLKMNGWEQNKDNPDVYTHPKLGESECIVIKSGDIPYYHNIEVSQLHWLQTLMSHFNENISVDKQIFNLAGYCKK